MTANSPHNYMDQAEKMLREYAAKNPGLAVWRKVWRDPHHSYRSRIDTVIVGVPNPESPHEPSTKIVLYTFLEKWERWVIIDVTFSAATYISKHVPFEHGWIPLLELGHYAKKLPSYT